MSEPLPERVDAAVSCSRRDEAQVEPILAGLRASGLSIGTDTDSFGGALLFFVSKASLASQRCAEEVLAAHAQGKPIVPVLLERLKMPDDLPDHFVPALQARDAVEAFEDKPEEEKRRGILLALAGFGIAAGGAGVAEAGSLSTEAPVHQSAPAQTSGSAPVVKVSPTAKTTAPVVKASSSLSARAIAFGGAAVATVLVVGAVVLLQGKQEPVAAPSGQIASNASTSGTARTEPGDPGTPAAPRPLPTDIATGEARVTLAQASYAVGKPIAMKVSGMPGHARDYVAIALKGSPGYGEVRYEYLQGKKDADIVLRAVMKPGDYEVRLFFGNDEETDRSDKIRYAVPLTITPAEPITLTPESAILTEGQPLRIAYAGLPGNDKDWIATAIAGSPDGNYISYVYSNGAAAGTAEPKPLMKAGKYEIRAYFDDLTSDRTVQARIPIEVIPAPPVDLALDAASYAPGATITISFGKMPGNKKDWVAMGRPGDEGYLTYEYTDGKLTGSETMRAPDEPGQYEIRAYFDDNTGDRTIRAVVPFTVGAVAPTP